VTVVTLLWMSAYLQKDKTGYSPVTMTQCGHIEKPVATAKILGY